MSKWNVWSISDDDGRALVVDEGSQKRCTESAERRNAAAVKYEVNARFEALPDGADPFVDGDSL